MQIIYRFLKTTVKGGILFFLPLVVIYIAVEKVIAIFTKVITPIATKLGIEHIGGQATIGLLIALLVLFICFIGGLLMKIKKLEKLNRMLDEKLTSVLPSYTEIKSKTAGQIPTPADEPTM